MEKIIWKGITKDFKGISMGELKNENAIKLEESSRFLEVGYILFILLGSAICTVALMLKRYFTGVFPINPIFIPIGLIIAFLLIIAHEYIHAIVYPKNAVMGLITPFPDYMNVINVVKQVPKGAMIQFYKFNFYWFND